MDSSGPTAADYAIHESEKARRKAAELEQRIALLERQVRMLYSFIDNKFDILWRDEEAWRNMR